MLFGHVLSDYSVAIDLGTANTRVYLNGRQMLVEQPTVVKLSVKTLEGQEIGIEVLPLCGGAIQDLEATTSLLTPLLSPARKLGIFKPHALACIPSDATVRERKALAEATRRSGASSVTIVPELLAAAIGAGLDVSSARCQMIIDIGDGVTDIAVIRAGDLIATSAVRTACSDLRTSVRKKVRDDCNLLISKEDADMLSRRFGATLMCAYDHNETVDLVGTSAISGKDMSAHIPLEIFASSLNPVLDKMMLTIQGFWRKLSPQLARELAGAGVHLTGGGARLPGIDKLIASKTGVEVQIAKDPLHAVIHGAQKLLNT